MPDRRRTLLRPALLTAVPALVASLVTGLVTGLPTASAASTVLCTGFDGCKALGMGNAGYHKHLDQMWWRMYAGHNCTNYVAYRMVRDGMSRERPWSGSGMAGNWGTANPAITDDVPTVGSVAWWRSGHVAYVEQVVSAEEIVVSEDSWSRGVFDWRRVEAGSSWPTGFIHFPTDVAATPVPPAPPPPPATTPPATTPPAPTPTAEPEPARRPKAKVRVTIRQHRHRRLLGVWVRVAAPARAQARGVEATPTGTVKVRIGKRKKRVRLAAGGAVVTFRKVHRGRHRFVVRYYGDDQLRPARAKGRVRIHRR